MSRCVEQVELVSLSVFGRVGHADGVGLDGNAALAFKIHGVKELILLITLSDGFGELH